MSAQGLEMWTVYDHPRDCPDDFIARLWLITAGEPQPTTATIKGPLAAIREVLANKGLVKLMRDPNDDAVIVETWL